MYDNRSNHSESSNYNSTSSVTNCVYFSFPFNSGLAASFMEINLRRPPTALRWDHYILIPYNSPILVTRWPNYDRREYWSCQFKKGNQ